MEVDPNGWLWVQVATLYNLCKAVQSFHVRGMVHCSLAPPTFSWFQGGQGWKVAASGDWAQAGMHVRSCYQLRYASPEVRTTSHAMLLLHAMSKGAHTFLLLLILLACNAVAACLC